MTDNTHYFSRGPTGLELSTHDLYALSSACFNARKHHDQEGRPKTAALIWEIRGIIDAEIDKREA